MALYVMPHNARNFISPWDPLSLAVFYLKSLYYDSRMMPYFYVGTINIESMRNMIIDKVSGKSRLGKQIKAPGCNALGQGSMSLDS